MNQREVLAKFASQTIMVVGDVMIDHYLYGSIGRQSPEAPVPVLLAQRDEYRLGGASNVANNLRSLGANVILLSLIGEDDKGDKIVSMLSGRGIDPSNLVRTNTYTTTEKLRVIDNNNKQLIRLDFEKTADISGELEETFVSAFDRLIDSVSGIIVSDYAKGVMSARFLQHLITKSNSLNKPVFVDPKPKHKDSYRQAFLITPNEKEAAEMADVTSITDDNSHEVGKKLQEELSSNIVLTRGKKGMQVFYKADGVFDVPTKAEEVFDVTGAGDTVISTIALACTSGADIEMACELANSAAHVVISKFGTETATTDDILKLLEG